MAKKKSDLPALPICAGQLESRRIIRDHARDLPATELETLRQIARCAREVEEALCVYHELHDPDLSDEELDARDHRAPAAAVHRVAEGRSALDISLHAWEWWTFDAAGARGARKRAW